MPYFRRPPRPPKLFPIRTLRRLFSNLLVITSFVFFFGISSPAFRPLRPSFANTLAFLSFFNAVRGLSSKSGRFVTSTSHSFSAFLLAPLYPHRGIHSPVSSSYTVFGVFFFAMPFFLANSSHFVGGWGLGSYCQCDLVYYVQPFLEGEGLLRALVGCRRPHLFVFEGDLRARLLEVVLHLWR